MVKFIHAADIHLDSPLRGLERYDGAPIEQIRGATRMAVKNLVRTAIAEKVDFVLIAGDLYDGDWQDFNTGLFLARQMTELRNAEVKVFVISGNHDAASQITRSVRMPKNVHVFSTDAPETIVIEDLDVAIHGQGFARRAVTDNLAQGYPPARPGMFNIGLLHTSVTGRDGHEPYAPCSLDDLRVKGYDYWALGHVHTRETPCEGDPWIVFPGNVQGRHIREVGAKGCTLVTVDGGAVAEVRHRELDVLRWAELTVNVAGCESGVDVLDPIGHAVAEAIDDADGRTLAIRLRLTGECPAHRDLAGDPERWLGEIRAAVTDRSGGTAWLEKLRAETRTELDVDAMAAGDGAIAGLLRSFDRIDGDDEAILALATELAPLRAKLPPTTMQRGAGLDLETPAGLRELLAEARELLLPRLIAEAGQ